MLVDLTFRQVCSDSSVCGLALACKTDGRCGPCERDNECSPGEVCVLDRCLLESLVLCRTASDCPEDHLCVTSTFAPGRRGNQTMRSFCLASSGGREQTEEDSIEDVEHEPADPIPVRPSDLLERLRAGG